MAACPHRRALAVSLFAIAFALAGPLLGQTDYDQPDETLPGFKATNVYHDFGSVDHVNIFSGDTGVVIPLGPEYPLSQGLSWQLKAYHSAKMWNYDAICYGGFGHAVVTGYPTLGAGWNLDLGHVGATRNQGWFYQAPDGGRHTFGCGSLGPQGVPACPSPSTPQTQYYTLDSTHDRVTWYPASNSFTVEFPDGDVQHFNQVYTRPRPANSSDPSPDFNDQYFNAIPDTRWGLTDYYDRFGTLVLHANYAADSNSNPWELSSIVLTPNTNARVINFSWITFQVSNSGWAINNYQFINLNPNWPVLQTITFPTAAGSLTTTFNFVPGAFGRPPFFDGVTASTCQADGNFPTVVAVPLLSSIALSGSLVNQRWSLSYYNQSTFPFCALSSVQLPTGGQIQYQYDLTTINPCPIPGCSVLPSATETPSGPPLIPVPQRPGDNPPAYDFTDASPAVVSRTEINADGSTASQTAYFRQDFWIQVGVTYSSTQSLRQVDVHRPDGNGATIADRYQFHVPMPKEIISSDSTGGLELVHYYYNQDVTPLTAPTPIRAVVSCYDTDSLSQECGYATGTNYTSGPGGVTAYVGTNARLQKQVTWYGDNPANSSSTTGGDCSVSVSTTPCWQSTFSGYDGYGEYATETKTANNSALEATGGTYWQSRMTTTNWIPQTGQYWLLKLFTSRQVTDQYSNGCSANPAPCSVVSNYVFDLTNGFLLSVQKIDAASGSSITRTFTWDSPSLGNPITELVSASGSQFSGTQFTTNRTFQNGLLLTRQESGLSPSWNSFDVTRDAATGVITSSRDANGLTTTYAYDALNRLTSAKPPGGEVATTYCYALMSGGSSNNYVLAKKDGTSPSACSTGGAPGLGSGTFEAYQYDGLGRMIREIRREPNTLSSGSYFAFRQRTYNAAGLPSFVSEWTPCSGSTDATTCFGTVASHGTSYQSYDFLGRARLITAADGNYTTKSFDDTYANPPIYNSDFSEFTALSNVGGQSVAWGSRKDFLGRLLVITDPAAGLVGSIGPIITYYDYNALDKLTDARVNNTQTRTFTYDALGLLRSESHPEAGSTSYNSFDARGKPLQWVPANGQPYAATYDAAGRLVASSANWQLYLSNTYDEAIDPNGNSRGFSKGKLTTSVGSNNFQSTGFSTGFFPGGTVSDSLFYNGLGGRLSQKTTTLSNGAASPTASWTYNSLGLVATESYPRIDPSSGTFVATTSYVSGLSTALSANGQTVVTWATYNPAGGLASYTAGNGITTTIDPDPNLMPRPWRIHTSDSNLDTGYYSYDGAGNIMSMGTDTFGYDANSRLLSATYSATSQNYGYDVFGNLVQKAGTLIGVDSATNRLTGVTYDLGGNVTVLGAETYSYDALNRQTKHDAPTSHWSYLLDGANERIVKAIPPAGPVARRDMARIILQAMGKAPRATCAGYFQDVPCADPERGWIERFYELGITSGCQATPRLFCPNSTTPRWQMAVLISVAMVLPAGGTVPASGTVSGVGTYNCTSGGTSLFADVLPTDTGCKFIHYIYAQGVTIGCSVTPRLFCPNDTTPHDQMEAFVSRAWNGFGYVPAGATYTFRGSGSAVLTEYQDSKVSKDYVYLGNRLVGTNDSTAGLWKYHATDHLGSVRVTWSSLGVERRKYWPWGDDALTPTTGRMAFAGMELDLEATRPRYYDHARSLETGNGRFLSPDLLGGKITDPQSWNRYTYARNNPLRYVDPNGEDIVDAARGFANAFGSDFLAGAGRSNAGNSDYRNGQAFGDAAAAVGGTALTLLGAGGEAGGFALDLTGAGAAIGVPVNIVSAGVIAEGATAAGLGIVNLSMNDLGSPGGPKVGSAGGPGAGKDFSKGTKDAARADSPNCVFCGKETTRQPGPNQSNIDHAISKVRGGNNTPPNAQNTCRTCNLQKYVKTTLEYLEGLFR
jgi:RHS repeat-associated protein